MRYVLGLGVPCCFQCLVILIVVLANTGNGSWLGLAAFLVGIFAVPGTLLFNGAYVRSKPHLGSVQTLGHCLLFAAIVPLALVFLFLLG